MFIWLLFRPSLPFEVFLSVFEYAFESFIKKSSSRLEINTRTLCKSSKFFSPDTLPCIRWGVPNAICMTYDYIFGVPCLKEFPKLRNRLANGLQSEIKVHFGYPRLWKQVTLTLSNSTIHSVCLRLIDSSSTLVLEHMQTQSHDIEPHSSGCKVLSLFPTLYYLYIFPIQKPSIQIIRTIENFSIGFPRSSEYNSQQYNTLSAIIPTEGQHLIPMKRPVSN